MSNVTPIRKINTYSEDTAPRILAFLASVRSLVPTNGTFEYGCSLIARIGMSAKGADSPRILLSNEECVEVLRWLAQVEPDNPRSWWSDPKDAPSHICGYQTVLFTIVDSLEAIAQTKSS